MTTEKTNEIELYSTEVPAHLQDETGSLGNEEVSLEDTIIPRLDLVQALSPCRNKNKPEYIPGAEEGMMYNSVTRELYGDSVNLIFVTFKKEFLLWKVRTLEGKAERGGFRGCFKTEKESWDYIHTLGAETPCVEPSLVHQHYALLIDSKGNLSPICVSMSGSKIKPSRKINHALGLLGRNRFSHVFRLSSFEDGNAKGDSYFNYDTKHLGFASAEHYEIAKTMYLSSNDTLKTDNSTD